MRVLRPLSMKLGLPGEIISTGMYLKEFRDVPVEHTHFSIKNYPPGSSGESGMRNDLLHWLNLIQIDRETSR